MSTETDIKWALDLLSPDPLYQENFISKYFQWIVWPFTTIGGTFFLNYMQGRPPYASIRRYPIAIALGCLLAKVFGDAKFHREAERDAVLRSYIKLHPEDFPPPERKTYNDEFVPWHPCR